MALVFDSAIQTGMNIFWTCIVHRDVARSKPGANPRRSYAPPFLFPARFTIAYPGSVTPYRVVSFDIWIFRCGKGNAAMELCAEDRQGSFIGAPQQPETQTQTQISSSSSESFL